MALTAIPDMHNSVSKHFNRKVHTLMYSYIGSSKLIIITELRVSLKDICVYFAFWSKYVFYIFTTEVDLVELSKARIRTAKAKLEPKF